ncbi:MAG: peptide deformylase [Bacteroidales bacterium]|jgi:peptide deformylase|nr:peptide deformylase [Bacteroidales bacterium]
MIYPVVIYGHPVLRKKAVEIDPETFEPEPLISDMFETMYRASGVGLAAPQIGKSIRLYVIDASPLAEDHPEMQDFKRVFINPEIVEHGENMISIEEGCLSVPNIHEDVKRYESLTMRYLNEHFEEKEEQFEGFKAIVVQHEYDHLDGIMFTDKVAPLRKRLLRAKLAAISKGKVKTDYKIITA